MKKGMHIKTKVAITAIVFMGVLTAVIAFVGYKLYHDNVMESYVSYADTVLEYAYRAAEEHGFGDMIASREMPEEYDALRSDLDAIKDSSDIEYLYAIYFEDIDDIHSLHYAINAKTQAELETGAYYTNMGTPCEEGSFEDDTLLILQQAVKSGKRENGTLEGHADAYGYMLNGYRVVFDSEGEPVGLICVEIDISRINVGLNRYLRIVLLIAVVFTAIVVFLYLYNTERYLIGPIVKIAERSNAFVTKMQSNAEPEELVFEEVPVRSKGELKELSDNVKSLADGVSTYMTNLKTMTAEKERIGAELELATRIQYAMLPHSFPAFPDRQEFDIFASMDPAKEVGGDFYNFFLIDDDHLALIIGDVSGKGVPAALFMMVTNILTSFRTRTGGNPSEILTFVNNDLCEHNKLDMFVTIWLGILEISTGKLTYSNAGHEDPVIYKKDEGRFELFKTKHGFIAGGMPGMKYTDVEVTLEHGDRLFVYTDGVPEATNGDNKLFGLERMIDTLNADPGQKLEGLLAKMTEDVNAFVGSAPSAALRSMALIH